MSCFQALDAPDISGADKFGISPTFALGDGLRSRDTGLRRSGLIPSPSKDVSWVGEGAINACPVEAVVAYSIGDTHEASGVSSECTQPASGDIDITSAPAQHALYAEFRPLVARLIRKYGDSPEMRKDLEGEIYCLFFNLLEAYDPARGVPLKPYLVHQLTTSVYTFARRSWRLEKREVCLEAREEAPAQLTRPSDQWDADIALRQIRELLPSVIAGLPLRQRQVVVWRYLEHQSFEEIALKMDIQVATTRSILRHGLASLRRKFEQAGVTLEL